MAQPTYFKEKIMSNGEVILTNTTKIFKMTTRDKTWVGDLTVYPLKKIFIDYRVQFQSDGSISLVLEANAGDNNFKIPIAGINWWLVETADISLAPSDIVTDETPYFFLSGNKLYFVSNPTVPTIDGLGSWTLTLNNVDPSSTDTDLWISNEGLALFDMKYYFINPSQTIQYFDSIDNIFLVNDPTAHLVAQPTFTFEPIRQIYTRINMLLGASPPWALSSPAESLAYFGSNPNSIELIQQQNQDLMKRGMIPNTLSSEIDKALQPLTFEQLQKNILTNPDFVTKRPCNNCK